MKFKVARKNGEVDEEDLHLTQNDSENHQSFC
jgi:hypothetical protein